MVRACLPILGQKRRRTVSVVGALVIWAGLDASQADAMSLRDLSKRVCPVFAQDRSQFVRPELKECTINFNLDEGPVTEKACFPGKDLVTGKEYTFASIDFSLNGPFSIGTVGIDGIAMPLEISNKRSNAFRTVDSEWILTYDGVVFFTDGYDLRVPAAGSQVILCTFVNKFIGWETVQEKGNGCSNIGNPAFVESGKIVSLAKFNERRFYISRNQDETVQDIAELFRVRFGDAGNYDIIRVIHTDNIYTFGNYSVFSTFHVLSNDTSGYDSAANKLNEQLDLLVTRYSEPNSQPEIVRTGDTYFIYFRSRNVVEFNEGTIFRRSHPERRLFRLEKDGPKLVCHQKAKLSVVNVADIPIDVKAADGFRLDRIEFVPDLTVMP
jgi:hypothetical protein